MCFRVARLYNRTSPHPARLRHLLKQHYATFWESPALLTPRVQVQWSWAEALRYDIEITPQARTVQSRVYKRMFGMTLHTVWAAYLSQLKKTPLIVNGAFWYSRMSVVSVWACLPRCKVSSQVLIPPFPKTSDSVPTNSPFTYHQTSFLKGLLCTHLVFMMIQYWVTIFLTFFWNICRIWSQLGRGLDELTDR